MPLTEKTLIPVGVAVLVIGGGSMWLTTLYAKVDNLEHRLADKIEIVDRIEQDVSQIKLDVREIKTILGEKDGRNGKP